MYKLLLHPTIEKKIQKIPREFASKLVQAMRDLCYEPRPNQSTQIGSDIYRLREGNYRIIYVVFDGEQTVFVSKVERRSEKTYRDIEVLLKTARLFVEQEKRRR